MTFSLFAALAVPFALQAATPAPEKPTPQTPSSFADLPFEQSTAPRCGMAFAIVQGWQEAGDTRGAAWPSLAEKGAREFFVKAMVRLIDSYSLEQPDVMRLVEAEQTRLQAQEFAAVDAMMPSCLALLEVSSTKGGV